MRIERELGGFSLGREDFDHIPPGTVAGRDLGGVAVLLGLRQQSAHRTACGTPLSATRPVRRSGPWPGRSPPCRPPSSRWGRAPRQRGPRRAHRCRAAGSVDRRSSDEADRADGAEVAHGVQCAVALLVDVELVPGVASDSRGGPKDSDRESDVLGCFRVRAASGSVLGC